MQSLKIELAVAAAALFALGVFVATRPEAADAASSEPQLIAFTPADFAAFDRNFDIAGQPCAVGLAAHRLCFGVSPLEKTLRAGMILPADVPILAAEFRVIVVTDLKATHLRTVRFGQTLALIDPKTRQITDILHLTAPEYASARQPLPPS